MRLFTTLLNNNIVHAVIKNESWEVDDWFVLCHKKQMKNTFITVQGIIEMEGIHIFAINMKKKDVLDFYRLMSYGVYVEAFKNCEGTVWELDNNGFKEYINKIPLNRARIKKWKVL